MTDKTLTTEQRKRDLIASLRYEPETGNLYWRKKPRNASLTTQPAGTKSSWGYVQIKRLGVIYKAHRVAWLLHYGDWPTGLIDHINGRRDDNRIANLRDADPTVNSENRAVAITRSSTGVLGVSYRNGRFHARIACDRKKRFLGVFDSIEEASSAYLNAKKELHRGYSDER